MNSGFGDDYLRVYQHRDESEARAAVDLVLSQQPKVVGPVLDLACGAGRHLAEFAERGLNALGLDLSMPLLQRASEVGAVVRGDMRRLPFRGDSFTLVTSFFTSFGYFADPSDDVAVLDEVVRVLRPRGSFAFDFLNSARVRAGLPSEDDRLVDGVRVHQTRQLIGGGRFVQKTIRIHDPADRFPRIFYERVRLYDSSELEGLLMEAGLRPEARFGDYYGAPATEEAARFIVIGTAA